MSQDKTVFCLWSGGLDSTYMIWDYLNKGYFVKAGYVEIKNNKHKTKIELKAIKEMVKIFNEYNFVYLDKITTISINNGFSFLTNFSQIPIWLLSILIDHECDKIAIGYVMNDDAISYLDDFQKIYKSYKSLYKYEDKKYPILEFPLKKENKEYIYNSLPENLRKHIVFCETPILKNKKYIPCLKCDSCKTRLYLELNDIIPIYEHKCLPLYLKEYKNKKSQNQIKPERK
ncbi:MAG: hypothetical protein ACOC2W_01275 [bacterium]